MIEIFISKQLAGESVTFENLFNCLFAHKY